MNVTWEVRRKWKRIPSYQEGFKSLFSDRIILISINDWKTVYTCSGSMPLDVWKSAVRVKIARAKGIGCLFDWKVVPNDLP